MWVWAWVCESVHCERVRNSCRRKREKERDRERQREKERERERERLKVCGTLRHTHTHTHTPKRPFTHTPRSPYKHTPWTYLALPKVHPVLLLRRARALLLHHHLPAQVHFPTYLAHPSLLLGPSCHIRWSLPSSNPRTFTPRTPSSDPYQQGNLVLQPGDCCLLILQRLCIKWWEGGFVCVSVCVRAPHKRVYAISLSLSFSLSLSLSLSLSPSLSLSLSLSMHAPAGGIDNHKVRGDNEHGPQAAGVWVRSVPAAIGSQHALARCQQPARDFVAADSQKFQRSRA